MEGLSPQALLSLRTCRLSEGGQLVNVWNFGDLEDLLKDFDPDEDREGSEGSFGVTDSEIRTDGDGVLAAAGVCRDLHTPGSVCHGTCLMDRSLCFTWPVEVYRLEHACASPHNEELLEEMPPLEGPDEYQPDLLGMPELESVPTCPVCLTRQETPHCDLRSTSTAIYLEEDLIFRAWAKGIGLAATVLIGRALCTSLGLPGRAATNFVNAMVLLYTSYGERY
ncbi:hypothetical protein KC19_2G028900 [Ceratodon purpureus]|uniref:Uncharacterized protein n=1 Tax=Ceratodon purpureus TaxID=3225 RepID=A0A8T0IRK5_CERPU|nr:hypothetical protein KC19_2G028900 [Ceratodon purpureus]